MGTSAVAPSARSIALHLTNLRQLGIMVGITSHFLPFRRIWRSFEPKMAQLSAIPRIYSCHRDAAGAILRPGLSAP